MIAIKKRKEVRGKSGRGQVPLKGPIQNHKGGKFSCKSFEGNVEDLCCCFDDLPAVFPGNARAILCGAQLPWPCTNCRVPVCPYPQANLGNIWNGHEHNDGFWQQLANLSQNAVEILKVFHIQRSQRGDAKSSAIFQANVIDANEKGEHLRQVMSILNIPSIQNFLIFQAVAETKGTADNPIGLADLHWWRQIWPH